YVKPAADGKAELFQPAAAQATRVPRNTAPSATATTPTATNASLRYAYAAAGWNNSALPSAAGFT
ncbi:hypothetical protein P2C05_18785, partial [Xanthomonas perforans]